MVVIQTVKRKCQEAKACLISGNLLTEVTQQCISDYMTNKPRHVYCLKAHGRFTSIATDCQSAAGRVLLYSKERRALILSDLFGGEMTVQAARGLATCMSDVPYSGQLFRRRKQDCSRSVGRSTDPQAPCGLLNANQAAISSSPDVVLISVPGQGHGRVSLSHVHNFQGLRPFGHVSMRCLC